MTFPLYILVVFDHCSGLLRVKTVLMYFKLYGFPVISLLQNYSKITCDYI